jgi:hypothetical protein
MIFFGQNLFFPGRIFIIVPEAFIQYIACDMTLSVCLPQVCNYVNLRMYVQYGDEDQFALTTKKV